MCLRTATPCPNAEPSELLGGKMLLGLGANLLGQCGRAGEGPHGPVAIGVRKDPPKIEARPQELLEQPFAFQVVADVLDCDVSTSTLGKTAGKDAAQEKPTYVSILGLGRTRALAEGLRGEAHAGLASFGTRGARLRKLADFIVLRKF